MKEIKYSGFGKRIREAIKKAHKEGVTWQKISSDTGITYPSLNRVLKGENASEVTLEKLGKWLDNR